MFEFLYELSAPAAVVLVLCGVVAVGCLGALLTRPLARRLRADEAEWNGKVSAVLSCYGVFYGLLLGLLAVAAYQRYQTTESQVFGEASVLVGVYIDIRAYPQPVQTELHDLLREYTQSTVERDWPTQARGEVPMASSSLIWRFLEKLDRFEPATTGQGAVHTAVLRKCDTMLEYRRNRLYTPVSGLPRILWVVVGVGGVLNLLLIWLLDMRIRNQLLLAGIVSCFLGLVVGVLALMDNPLRGPLAVQPEPFRVVLELAMAPKSP
jgi:hypothetical protein